MEIDVLRIVDGNKNIIVVIFVSLEWRFYWVFLIILLVLY